MRSRVVALYSMTVATTLGVASPPFEVRSSNFEVAQASVPAMYGYRVINVYPHDSRAFTQGLIFRDGALYESTGQFGQSTLRKVELTSGKVLQQHAVATKYFGEGLTEWRGKLIQLTWQTGVGFVYDLATFKQERTFEYKGEGWGLTNDGKRLILSDGGSALRFFNPDTFQETGRVVVRDRGKPIDQLNELEYVRGEVFANVWHSQRIARIALPSGEITGWIDLTGLVAQGDVGNNPDAVLNGIAYDATGDRLFVTGKLWPRLFEIRLERR